MVSKTLKVSFLQALEALELTEFQGTEAIDMIEVEQACKNTGIHELDGDQHTAPTAFLPIPSAY